jgi:hypothetical protein
VTQAQEQPEAQALTTDVLLNAAVAFAGHVATAAEQAAAQHVESEDRAVSAAALRQYLLETATLCLRRLGESYSASADEETAADLAAMLQDGAQRATRASSAVETLGDLGLDLLDRLLP